MTDYYCPEHKYNSPPHSGFAFCPRCEFPEAFAPGTVTTGAVLSLFPGIDLLGRGFEAEGFCVVRGPDTITGGDVRSFHPPAGVFSGIIGGSPCQDFSKARRAPPTGEGLAMLAEFARVVTEAQPTWFLLENVPQVPTITVPGYTVQRFDLNARECGVRQNRPRHFQYGDLRGWVIIVTRDRRVTDAQPCATASEGRRSARRSWADFCALQGLPRDFDLPGWTREAKYHAVGNGVPIPMARVVARAVIAAREPVGFRLCRCGCGRPATGKHDTATVACRKRLQRQRDASRANGAGQVTPLFDLAPAG
jgi:DNA (cytosine-5)-methyltransferase 1